MVRFRWPTPLNVSWRERAESLIRNALGGDASFDVDDADEDSVTNHEFFLDLIDATLDVSGVVQNNYYFLDRLLKDGASAWRVDENGKSLIAA